MDIPTCRVLSLCSGVGGLDLGLKLAMPTSRTVAYMEIEAYACEILVKRMQEKILDPAPLWSDIKSFDGKPWRGKVDLITGGYAFTVLTSNLEFTTTGILNERES